MSMGILMAAIVSLSPMRGGDVNYRPMRAFDDATWVWGGGRESVADSCSGRKEDNVHSTTTTSNYNLFFRLRNDFTSDGSPLSLFVSADERYVLLLDGAELSRGPARGMPSHWFCQKVTCAVAAGTHRLDAVVWTLGDEAPTAQLSQGGGFFLKAEGAYDAQLTTGKGNWRIASLHGTTTDGKTYPEAFGGGTQFRVVGTSVLDEEPVSNAWTAVRRTSEPFLPAAGRWGRVPPDRAVHLSSLPEMMMRPIKPGEIPKEPISVPAHVKREFLFDLGDYYCAYPFLTVSGGKGAKIRLGFSECLVGKDGKKLHRDARDGAFTQAYIDTYLPDGRDRAVFTVPWWRCGKWCKLEIETADAPLTIDDVTLKETRYPISLDGSFAAEGDASLAAIGRMCERGVQMCAHEIMFDCPFYEQQMYPGDILMSFAALRAMTRDLRLPLQGLALFDAARQPSGLVPMNWPCRTDQRGSTWTLSWVAGVGEIALWGGDENRNWLKDLLPGVTHTLLSYARIENGDGLLVDPPGWNFLDWTKEWKGNGNTPPNGQPGNGPDACLNLLYLQAMERTVDLATAVGETELADYWRHRAQRLAAGIRKVFWDEARGGIADTPQKTSFSEHALALSITTECLPQDRRDRAFSMLVSAPDLTRASYMLHLVFGAYFRYRRADLFLKKLDPWRNYLKLGLRCPLEAPEFPRSDCHAFASTPLYHFHAGLAGVTPAAPFFSRVRVAPCPGQLTSVRATTPHPKGVVKTDLRFDGKGGARGTVTLPAGTGGTFEWAGTTLDLAPGENRISLPEDTSTIDPDLQAKCQAVCDWAVRTGLQGAVQFCAYRDGKCIVDVCAGSMTTNAGAPKITKDTLFPVFSTEKPLLATAAHRAVEQGKMAYDKPLCTWWPEFTGDGKEKLTLGETLGYRSGMPPSIDTNVFPTVESQCDWSRVCAWAAGVKPECTPGTVQRYMPRSYAWCVGHPLEVAMGKPLNDVLTDEVLRPAGIVQDFYFAAADAAIPRIATVYKDALFEGMNDDRRRRMCMPSSWAVGSARGIARFYNRLCGFDGQPPLVSKATLDRALVPSRHATDPLPSADDMQKNWYMIFGMGYGLWGEADNISRVFGHGGYGGSEGLCDRGRRLVVGYTSNFFGTVSPVRAKLYGIVGMKWRYWKDADADIQDIQMRTLPSNRRAH